MYTTISINLAKPLETLWLILEGGKSLGQAGKTMNSLKFVALALLANYWIIIIEIYA